MKFRVFKSASQLREWLATNHARETELWVGMYNQRTPRKSITYKEALDEALCFGWIDGVRKSVDEVTYRVRFTPRKAKSYWSQVNVKRMKELTQAGRVALPGLDAYERRDQISSKYSFENKQQKLDPTAEKQFEANAKAWEFFNAQAPWYKRTASFWVTSAKKEETRIRRLQTLIRDSQRGRRIGLLSPKSSK